MSCCWRRSRSGTPALSSERRTVVAIVVLVVAVGRTDCSRKVAASVAVTVLRRAVGIALEIDYTAAYRFEPAERCKKAPVVPGTHRIGTPRAAVGTDSLEMEFGCTTPIYCLS